MLRGLAVLAALGALVRALPGLPDWAALAGVVVLGALAAVPLAWGAAVRQGHALAVWRAGGWRVMLGGAALRVAVALGLGVIGAGLLVIRLGSAGPAIWTLAVAALPLSWGLAVVLQRRLARQAAGPHARRLAQVGAQGLAAGGLTLAGLALGLMASAPGPDAGTGVAPLVGQALALAHLWAGLEAYGLGLAAEFGDWGRGAALAVAALGLFGMFWALAGLALACALPGPEWRRALAPASDAPAPPGRTGLAGPGVALALAGLAMAAGLAASARLGAVPVAERPAARAQVAVEAIGDALYASGTQARLATLRAEALAEDAASRAALRAELEAGFAAMAANVGPFLDDYYSLSGEYGRLWRWAWGEMEGHLAAELAEALHAGAPLARFEAAQAVALDAARARAADLAAAEAALLAQARIDGLNPARLRLVAVPGAPPVPAARLAADLERAQARWGVAAGTGVIAAVFARRVVAGLAARGLAGVAARMAVRAGGLFAALGVDYALVKLDEYQNRADFEAAILSQIAAQRAAALAALDPPAE